MRKWGILSACLPILVCGTAIAGVPAYYLEEQRCLAVLNVAAAAFQTLDEPLAADAHALRQHIETGYGQLVHAISAESDLTSQQVDKGLDIFDEEQRHWVDAFGEATEEPARTVLVGMLMKKAEHCLKPKPK